MVEYELINWKDFPDLSTPLMAINLNHMDAAIFGLTQVLNSQISDIASLKVQKVNQTDFLTVVQSVTFNSNTGEITIVHVNGQIIKYDTGIDKIAVNFDYDDNPSSPHYGSIVLTLEDGTYKYIDISSLIQTIYFDDTERIKHTSDGDHHSFDLVKGSITGEYLETNYLTSIISYSESANLAATLASEKASSASASEINASASASSAAISAESAADSATTAWNKANEAGASASSAASSATNALVSASSSNSSAVESNNSALKSEGYAIGTQNGVPVTEGSEYYNNNAKYYKDQVDTEIEDLRNQVYTKEEVNNLVDTKQDTLTPGKNIDILNNIISSKTSATVSGERLVFS